MAQQFTHRGRLPTLTDITSAARRAGRNFSLSQAFWREMSAVIVSAMMAKIPRFRSPVTIHIHCLLADRGADLDKVYGGAAKIILDALRHCGIVRNDTQACVSELTFSHELSRNRPAFVVRFGPLNPDRLSATRRRKGDTCHG